MQWQPTIQAGFCLQIKVFNYTQRFDEMVLTSRSAAPYEARRGWKRLSETRLFIADSEASK